MKSVEWAAGLFEGEGCITVQAKPLRSGIRAYPALSLNMTDEEPVRWFAEVFEGLGAHVYGPYQDSSNRNKKPQWAWRACGAKCLPIMALLFEHLGPRRQARWLEVLSMYEEER